MAKGVGKIGSLKLNGAQANETHSGLSGYHILLATSNILNRKSSETGEYCQVTNCQGGNASDTKEDKILTNISVISSVIFEE